MDIEEVSTPALCADLDYLEWNLQTMAERVPGTRLRPHVKAHKMTQLAARQHALGHTGFTCATAREVLGLAEAGLGTDLLLANELLDPLRLSAMARCDARVTIAVDSEETILAAHAAGIDECVIDIRVGFRCGCEVEEAPFLADLARSKGMNVRGVMGYEGHAMGVVDLEKRQDLTHRAMERLLSAHELVGGDLITGAGTGTHLINTWVNEVQAGSYVLMDTAYTSQLDQPFKQALFLQSTVISKAKDFVVCDAGLKAQGMDHGNPTYLDGEIMFCSDEHTNIIPTTPLRVGDQISLVPAHVDPTMAKHEILHLVRGGKVVDQWNIDLRHW
ncbi:MAG: alanine racemase [Acidimicrobiales bacterium]|jgi:D-serine deaminase-like pyridoxal phosphate-dependent protein|nr:alanine racemase [Acidimicrobiales bacterium]